MTSHEITADAYLELVGAAEGPAEITAAEFVQMRGNPMSASDLVPRRNLDSSMVDTETPAKTEFGEWLRKVSPYPIETEYCGIPDRLFRFDWAIPALMVAFEYDGINAKAHASANGVFRDSEKGNLAQLAGWILIRVNARSLREGNGYTMAERAIELRAIGGGTG